MINFYKFFFLHKKERNILFFFNFEIINEYFLNLSKIKEVDGWKTLNINITKILKFWLDINFLDISLIW